MHGPNVNPKCNLKQLWCSPVFLFNVANESGLWLGCSGVAIAAVVVNHRGSELANESALQEFSQKTVGCSPAHMEVCPGQNSSAL